MESNNELSLDQQVTIAPIRMKDFYPWIIWTFSAAFLFYKYIIQVSPSVMTSQLMAEFHMGGAGLGNLAACYFYSYLLMQLPVGVLLDRYSVRRLTTLAIAACGVGALIFSHANNAFVAESARALVGFGAAFATVSYMKLMTLWFPHNRFAFMAGLLGTATMLGAAAGEAPVSLLVQHVGWRHTLYLVAIAGIFLAVLFFLLVRDKKVGQDPSAASVQNSPHLLSGLWQVCKNKQNWLLCLYSGLAFSPVSVFGGLWGVPFLIKAHNLSDTSAATVVSLVFIGLAVGGPVLGWLAERIGKRRQVMAFGTALSLVSVLCILYVDILPHWLLTVFMFTFGFGTGAFLLAFAIGKDINSIFLAATVIAFINTADALWGAVTEPLTGALLDVGWSGTMVHGARVFSAHDFHLSLLTLPCYLLLALAVIPFIRHSAPK